MQEYIVKMNFENGNTYKNSDDLYNSSYINKIICRESCDRCVFANQNRISDLTIADFKSLHEIFTDIKSLKNRSMIIANSTKGIAIINQLQKNMEVIPCKVDIITRANPRFTEETRNPNRYKFFLDFTEGVDIFTCLKKNNTNHNLLHAIWRKIPIKLRVWVKKGLKK